MGSIDWNGEFVAFFLLSVLMITGSVLMVSFTKVVHMVLSMAAVFLGVGGMFIILDAEFLAFVQVLIYAGAVSILMIFGIMMTNHRETSGESTKPLRETLAAVAAIALFGLLFFVIQAADFTDTSGAAPPPAADNTLAIGELLFHGYIVPFELVSVLLTVAFIGAIVLARKEAD